MAIIDIKRTVSLDGAIMPVALEGTLYGGENQAHRFIINATKDGAALNLTGSVTASFLRKADDAEVPLTGEIIGGGAAVTLVQSCYTQPGRFELTIFITQNGSKTALYSCNGNVRNTSASEIVDPGHVVPDISDIVAEYARMQAASDAAEAAAANANEAAQFATDDEWTNGDTLQTGRVYQTLHMANFEEETAGQYLRVISGNVAQAERVNQSGWSVYRYDLPHRMLIRMEAIEKNTPTVQGVLPMAAVLISGSTETLYSLDSDRTGTYVLADALLVNYSTTLNASAIKNVSFTAVANRQFEDVIVCLDHAADFDKIVVFGDSIFANYINSTTVGNGVVAQFASLMGLSVVNNAVGGATLSTIQTSPKNVVQQVQDYIASATPGGTPLYMIDGGTNDQYNGGAGLNNLGQYTDGVNGITNTIYGATYRIINDLLGFGAQPWQIVITTPIPKGIRGDAAYVATMDAQLTAIAGAMAEIAMVQQCNVINGYGAPFDNLTTDTAKAIIMPDDTHPSVYGAKLYAERIFRNLGVANQQEVTSLKSAISYLSDDIGVIYNTDVVLANGSVSSPSSLTAIHTETYITCRNGDTVTIFVSAAPLAADDAFTFGYEILDVDKNRLKFVDYSRVFGANSVVDINDVDAAYIRFTIAEAKPNAAGYTPIRITDFNKNDVYIKVVKAINVIEDVESLKDDVGILQERTAEIDNQKADKTELYKVLPTETIENIAIATFDDGSDEIPVKELRIAIEPVQAGSGDPSPDNIRPISGWTEAHITKIGKNLLKNTLPSTYVRNGVTFTSNADGSVTANGTATELAYAYVADRNQRALYLHAGNYKLSGVTGGAVSTGGYWIGINKTVGNTGVTIGNIGDGELDFTIDGYTNCGMWIAINRNVTVNDVTFYPMVRYAGIGNGDYEPYRDPTIYDITLPSDAGTVYGGTLDVMNGVLTVDRGSIANYNGETLPDDWISDRDVYTAGSTPTTGAQVVYQLATPITYQLTPQEVDTLLGVNNISADTGDIITLTYRADVAKYIDNKIAELQALVLENNG